MTTVQPETFTPKVSTVPGLQGWRGVSCPSTLFGPAVARLMSLGVTDCGRTLSSGSGGR
jgi:hypothetical protein